MAKGTIHSSKIFWESTESDLSNCLQCKDVIYGSMFYPVLSMGCPIEETEYTDIEIKLCLACYTLHYGDPNCK